MIKEKRANVSRTVSSLLVSGNTELNPLHLGYDGTHAPSFIAGVFKSACSTSGVNTGVLISP